MYDHKRTYTHREPSLEQAMEQATLGLDAFLNVYPDKLDLERVIIDNTITVSFVFSQEDPKNNLIDHPTLIVVTAYEDTVVFQMSVGNMPQQEEFRLEGKDNQWKVDMAWDKLITQASRLISHSRLYPGQSETAWVTFDKEGEMQRLQQQPNGDLYPVSPDYTGHVPHLGQAYEPPIEEPLL